LYSFYAFCNQSLPCFSDTYFIGLEHYCVGSFCLKLTQFQALVDSGTSFTYLPAKIYEKIVLEVIPVPNFLRAEVLSFPLIWPEGLLFLNYSLTNK
jgi:hypothetical protein